ncbi:Forkhead Box Protein O1 [Manis pentadactyla]|nr:Forkhead Box Protein O1 [Manis pentadactyla]
MEADLRRPAPPSMEVRLHTSGLLLHSQFPLPHLVSGLSCLGGLHTVPACSPCSALLGFVEFFLSVRRHTVFLPSHPFQKYESKCLEELLFQRCVVSLVKVSGCRSAPKSRVLVCRAEAPGWSPLLCVLPDLLRAPVDSRLATPLPL